MKTNDQINLDFTPRRDGCPHRFGYYTMAYVPAGVVCSTCGALLLQFIPQSPEVLGYVSADWAWHHRDGRPWTTQGGGNEKLSD